MGYSFLDKIIIYQILIEQLDHIDNYSLVIHENLTSDTIIEIVSNFYELYGLPVASIWLEDTIISDDLSNSFEKAEVKLNGELWTIHKNDKDTFPSNPHAHCYHRHIKAHLGNGYLYENKRLVCRLKKKEFDLLRSKIKSKMGVKSLSNLKYDR